MAVVLKSASEIEKMRRAGRVVREVLELVRGKVKPGVTTYDLEKAAEERLKELGIKPAFKGYHGYPCALCTSINSEVVHGIPGKLRLVRGDIISVDIGAIVEWISAVMTLLPGDLILTGTPAGVGPLEHGDTVSVTIEGIGTLTNPVIRKGK